MRPPGLTRRRTRREFLADTIRLGAGAAGVAMFGPQIVRTARAQGAPPERVKVLIEDVTEATAAAFACGRTSAVDIVAEAGRAGLRGAAGGEFTSGLVDLPFPATHLGVHWLLRDASPEAVAVAVRRSADGRRWSEWEWLEIEAVSERRGAREVFAFLTAAERARHAQYRIRFSSANTVTLDAVTVTAINSLDGSRAPVAASAALATLTAPGGTSIAVITREGWGCDESLLVEKLGKDRDTLWPEMYVPAKKVVLHHTATSNGYTDGAAEVRAVWGYHAITQGWGDIGYNALVDKFGKVYEGRHGRGEDPATREILSADVVAGHVYHHNYGSTGISALGHFDRTKPTEAMLLAVDAVATFECDRHFVDPNKATDFLRSDDVWHDGLNNCSGHYESSSTGCPGRNLKSYLPTLRKNVASRLSWSTTTSLSETARAPRELSVGDSVSFGWSSDASLFCLEGWYKEPSQEPIAYLSGYEESDSGYGDTAARSQRWEPIGNWINPYTFSDPGHYTMHVRADAGAYEANLTFFVKGSSEGENPSTGTVHVGDLAGATRVKGKSGFWEALVTVLVHDAGHNPVANATVAGTWSGATSGSVSGVTGSDGRVTLSTGSISGGSSVTFAVTGISGAGTYDSGANHDPDPDSDGTTITVEKPS